MTGEIFGVIEGGAILARLSQGGLFIFRGKKKAPEGGADGGAIIYNRSFIKYCRAEFCMRSLFLGMV